MNGSARQAHTGKLARLRFVPTGTPCSGSLPRAPRAVLFDVYGTLFLQVPRADQSLKDFIRRNGFGSHPRSSHTASNVPWPPGTSNYARAALPFRRYESNESGEGFVPGRSDGELRRLAVGYELATHSCWPVPACRKVIASVAGHGARLGIVSNAQFYTPLFFQAFFGCTPKELGFHPSLCLYSYTHGAGKPGPELYALAKSRLGRLGIAAREAVMVGNDHRNDAAAARRAGFMTVLVAGDMRTQHTIRAVRARSDAVIDQLSSLHRLVDEACRPPSTNRQ